MFDFISKKSKEQKRKEIQEQELRASLSEKLSRYQSEKDQPQANDADNDHTILMLNGRKLRVAKKEITITDIDTEK